MLPLRWLRPQLALALAVVLSFSGVPTTEVAATSAAPLDGRHLGMFVGFDRGDRFDRMESELGSRIRYVVTMADSRSVSGMRSSVWGQFVKDDAYLPDVADRVDAIVSVPLAFGRGGLAKTTEGQLTIRRNLLATAAGELDADYRVVARNLKKAGYGDAIIRLGHEFDGLHAPYSARNNEAAYIAAFRRVHNVMKAESPAFRFEWTSMRAHFVAHGPPAYPGNDYVDIVGLDIYWRDSSEITDSIWSNQYERVLEAHRAFAASKGKPVSYPEWGRAKADTPRFLDLMHNWFSALPATGSGSLVYQSYFNPPGPTDGYHPYNLEELPKVKRRYIELFGGTTATISAPTTTAATTTTAPPPEIPTTTAPTTTTTVSPAPTTLKPAERLQQQPTTALLSDVSTVEGGESQAAITARYENGDLRLSWMHPEADRYILRYKKTGSPWWTWSKQGSSTSSTIVDADSSTGYTVQVIYIEGANWQQWSTLEVPAREKTSAVSSQSLVTTTSTVAPTPTVVPTPSTSQSSSSWSVPGGPTQAAITAMISDGKLILNWSHPDGDRYILRYRKTGSRWWIWSPQNTSTSQTIDDVEPSTGYSVQVIYIDGAVWQEWSTLEVPA